MNEDGSLFECPSCGQPFDAGEIATGQDWTCPACGRTFAVEEDDGQPNAAGEARPAAPPARNANPAKAEAPASFSERGRPAPFAKLRKAGGRRAALAAISAVALLCLLGFGVRSCGSSRGSSRRAVAGASSSRPRAPEPTQEEKLAIGRVFRAIWKLSESSASMTSSGDLGTQFVGGLISGVLWKRVNTEGCPGPVADACKGVTDAVARFKAFDSLCKVMAASRDEMIRQGRYIDPATRAKLAEFEAKWDEMAEEVERRLAVLCAIFQSYGDENLMQWVKESEMRFPNDEDLFIRED